MKKSIALFLALLLIFSLTACSSAAKTPEDAIEKALTTLQKGDLAKFSLYIADGNAGSAQTVEKFLPTILSYLTYEIASVDVDGDKAIATVSITNKDLALTGSQLFAAILNKSAEYARLPANEHPTSETWDSIYQDFLKRLLATEKITVSTTEIEVDLIMQDGQWKIQGTEDFLNKILGGCQTYFEKLRTQRVEAVQASPAAPEQTTPAVTEKNEEASVLYTNGALGNYYISIKDAKFVKTSDGNVCAIVSFDWTNNSGKNQAPAYSINIKVSQDGAELKDAYVDDWQYSPDIYWKKVKSGETVQVQKAYTLSNVISPIDVQIEEAFSWEKDSIVYKQIAL